MNIKKNLTDLIGGTPLFLLQNFKKNHEINATILAKLECFNPAGSAKDRIAKQMILDAEAAGVLKKGSVIIEPTSGNTGIGLASVGTARGYRVVLTMPETMTMERRSLLKAYGAEIVLTEGATGMKGAVDEATKLQEEMENAVILGQFENPANALAHFEKTGPEIWADTQGTVDIFVAGVGTGGTISGVGKFLKEQNPNIKIVAVEPASSPLLSQGIAGGHKIQGIGANFVPKALDTNIYEEVIAVTNEDAFATAKAIAREEGLLVGISSGAALFAASVLANREENHGKTIVTFFPDTGERYISTGVYD